MIPCKKTRTVLSIKEKIKVLEMAKDRSKKINDILNYFAIGLSTFHKIKAQETKIRETYISNKNLKCKRNKGSMYAELNKALAYWFTQSRSRNAIINGPAIIEKAQQLAQEMDIEFKPSNGWLQRWKESENISFQSIHGEKVASDYPVAEQWVQSVLPDLVSGYESNNIYNADESGFFYKALPRGTFATFGDKPTTGKMQKERLTALFICNMDGSDKQLFIIGKSATPRCFKNILRPPLPYYNNKNAWMTHSIFTDILNNFNKKLNLQKRNIILFIDNAPCHKLFNIELSNIKVIFLPPNTTCIIQPLDQGIIQNAKVFYRQQLIRKQLIHIDLGHSFIDFAKSITLLEAMHMLLNAWSKVKPETITNCFRKAGFLCHNNDDNRINIQPTDEIFNLSFLNVEKFDEYVDCDRNLECYGELNDADIIKIIRQEESIEIEEEIDEPELPKKPGRQEVIYALEILRAYYDTEIGDNIQEINTVENRVMKCIQSRLLQTKITNYFQ